VVLILRDLEFKILSELMKNSRLSDRELARKVGCSARAYNPVQGNITSYFKGEIYGSYPCVDINDNGKIDMRDIGMIARYFGAFFRDFNYPFRADLNFDFRIDMRDIGACARGFGTGPLI
jgi:hypothetical protein